MEADSYCGSPPVPYRTESERRAVQLQNVNCLRIRFQAQRFFFAPESLGPKAVAQ